MVRSTLSFEDKVFRTIERLLRNSGRESWMLVSVVDEANCFCYKTVHGVIGTVRRDYIIDRINSGLY